MGRRCLFRMLKVLLSHTGTGDPFARTPRQGAAPKWASGGVSPRQVMTRPGTSDNCALPMAPTRSSAKHPRDGCATLCSHHLSPSALPALWRDFGHPQPLYCFVPGHHQAPQLLGTLRSCLVLTKLFPAHDQHGRSSAQKGNKVFSHEEKAKLGTSLPQPGKPPCLKGHPPPHSSSSLLPGESFQQTELLLRLVCLHPQQGGKSWGAHASTAATLQPLLCPLRPSLPPSQGFEVGKGGEGDARGGVSGCSNLSLLHVVVDITGFCMLGAG